MFRYKHELTNLFGEVGNGGLFFLNGYLPFHEKFCYLGKQIENREKFDVSFVTDIGIVDPKNCLFA